MSTKRTIDIDINTNADQAAKQFETLATGVNKAANSADNLDAKFEDVFQGIEPLTTRLGEAEDRLYELALAGDTTSREYQELLTKVGQYRKVQIQTDLAVDAAATTLSQKLGGALTGATSGFAAIQGAIGLVSTESEELNAVLLRVQSALALSQGVQGVKDAIPAFQQLGQVAVKALTSIRNAIGALGVGALVFGITFLVTKFDEIKEILGINNKSLEEQLELEKQITEEKQKQLKEMNQIVSNNQDFINRQIQIVKNEEKLKSLSIDSEKNATKIRNLTKETIGLELQNLRIRLASTEELLSTQEKLQIKSEIYRKEQELLRVDEQALADARKKNSTKKAEQDQKAIDDAKELARLEQEAMEREIDEEIELQRQLDQIQRENEDRFRTEEENEILLVEEKYDRLQAMAQGNADALNEIEIARLNELNDVKNKFTEKEVELDELTNRKKLELAAASFSAISEIVGSFNTQNAKDAEKQFKIQKAFNLAAAVTNTALAVTGALTAGGNPIKLATGAQFVEAGIAATIGAANIIKIASSKFGQGTSGGGGTDTAVNTATQSPQFNVVGDSGINQLASLQQEPVQAFVVSGEVTTAQALDRNRVQNATL